MTEALKLERKFDRLALVGFCMPHREWVPYEDQEMEVWGLNRGYIFQPREDKHFEMHGRAIWEWKQRRPGNHIQWLQRFPGPVIMHEAVPDIIPNSVTYPLLEVAEDLGKDIIRFAPDGADPKHYGVNRSQTQVPYLGSTIAQQIALAIHMGYKEIALYGIDLNTTSEYAWQKPGVEHMLGMAAGRGIKVAIPDMCPLLRSGIYGRGYKRPEGENVSPEQWQERINACINDRERIAAEKAALEGSYRECEWVLQQMVPGLDHELLDKRLGHIKSALESKIYELARCEGALQETLHWAHQTPEGQPADDAVREMLLARMAEGEHAAEGPEEGLVETMVMDVREPAAFDVTRAYTIGTVTNGHDAEPVPEGTEQVEREAVGVN